MGLSFGGGDDKLDIDNPTFLSDTLGTVSGWWQGTTLSGTQIYWSASKKASLGDELRFNHDNPDPDKNLEIVNFDGPTTTIYRMVTSDDPVVVDVYLNGIVTSSGSTTKLFINGIENSLTLEQGTNNGDWFGDNADSDVFSLGVLQRGGDLVPLVGKAGSLAIWDIELTANEIISISNGIHPFAIRNESLVLLWDCYGDETATEPDRSGTGNNGTITDLTHTTHPAVELMENHL